MIDMRAAKKAAELANAVPGSDGLWDAKDFLFEGTPSDDKAFVQFITDADAAARKAQRIIECNVGDDSIAFLSPFILPDDVDPLLIEARKLAAEVYTAHSGQILDGVWDDTEQVQRNLKALRRGIEIAEARK